MSTVTTSNVYCFIFDYYLQVESALKEHIIEEVLHEYTVTKSGGDKTIIVKAIDYMQVKV